MHTTRFSDLAELLQVKPVQQYSNPVIQLLVTDSRKLLFAGESVFFAMSTAQKNANEFIPALYEKGVRCFVTHHFTAQEALKFPEGNFLIVDDVLFALQTLAAFHRHKFQYPVIGITGSNGKTIVKEWLFQLLNSKYNIIRSPKSYNSQVGVPLAVWQMDETHELGIFEAGISQPGEMQRLQRIIDPGIGIFTFLGHAHDEGFKDHRQKLEEKLQLFANCQVVFYCADEKEVQTAMEAFSFHKSLKLFSWGRRGNPTLQVKEVSITHNGSIIFCAYRQSAFSFFIPFTDEASIHNAITCCCVLLHLEISIASLIENMPQLRAVEMRLELKQGTNNCSIINDSYSADINSLNIAMDFLDQQQQHSKKTVILSDVLESGQPGETLYRNIAAILVQKKISRFIGIGPKMQSFAALFDKVNETHFFSTTEKFLEQVPQLQFRDETILLKGARVFRFETISKVLEQKLHQTVLEIDLNALRHNIKVYQHQLHKSVQLMAMVKAFSYGSGSFEIASLLQHTGVNYLGVAYADEGVELRKAGIHLPVMVMNTEEAGFDAIIENRLEPELYSFKILLSFRNYLQLRGIEDYPVHIKYDTGMHRLGFEEYELGELCSELTRTREFRVVSIFSHLAASADKKHDAFTHQQGTIFVKAAAEIEGALGYRVLKHIANTSAIHRHPSLQLDMVRLGIGMYGVDEDETMQQQLRNVTTLKTSISQIKHIKAGESVGYSRSAVAEKDMQTATVRIGYADGYPRILSNGAGHMLVNGKLAPVVGKICMDMTILDISGITAAEEDEVIVFGEALPVSQLAGWAHTIAYEILTNISQRVRRVYFEE
jgi:alanine racemase